MNKATDKYASLNKDTLNFLTGTTNSDILGERKVSPLNEVSDTDIVSLFLERNEDAISIGQSLYGKRMTDLAARITGHKNDAEEIVNDVWLTAWNLIPPHEPFGYLPAFLLSLTRRASLDHVKFMNRQKRSIPITEITEELEACLPSSDNVENAVLNRQIEKYINEFLHTLPKQSRVIFVRRYYFAESVKTISKKLGVTNGSVRTSLSRTRNSLKTYLEKMEISV